MGQEFLKHAVPDYLVRALTSFPLGCQIKKLQQSTQQWSSTVNESKLYLFFCQIGKKYIFWCAAEF